MADLRVQKYLEVILAEIDAGLFPEEYFNDVFDAEGGDEKALQRIVEARYNCLIERADVSRLLESNENLTYIKRQVEQFLARGSVDETLELIEQLRVEIEQTLRTTDIYIRRGETAVPEKIGGIQKDALRFTETGSIEMGVLEREYVELEKRLKDRISEWESKYGENANVIKNYIEERLEIIEQERAKSFGYADIRYIEDVLDTLKILWNKTLRFERRMFAETSETKQFKVSLFEEKRPQVGLVDQEPRQITRVQTEVRVREEGELIDALVNRKRAGMIMTLRLHQWDILEQIQLDWGMQESGNNSWQEGVVISPTGSGKTHVMAATVELGINEGWLDFSEKGNKVIILTHRKEITKQNLRRIRSLLNPVFRKCYGRDIIVTKVGSGVWDMGGDAVVVSVPTVGRKNNIDKVRNDLAKRGLKKVLMLQDEYHHSGASTWGRFRRVVKEVVAKGYTLGFTATMRESDRAKSNVLIELNAGELMRSGALPPMELIQVQTGTDLRQIPTQMGEFSTRELSQTVRNPERYEHAMRALEFNGERVGNHMAPTLMFTVDKTHAFETAAYYQMYFKKIRESYQTEDGAVIKSLGNRSIAVVTEDMSEDDVKRILEAYRSGTETEYERYEYGSTVGDDSNFINVGKIRGKIDGIVAVITDHTSDDVRRLLKNGSKSGIVEAVVNIGVLEEGFDGWWIQNLVGGRPRLKTPSGVQKPQEIGRPMRWGLDEVDDGGRLKRTPRRRVAIDLIDNTGVDRPLMTYFDVLGIDKTLSGSYGQRIDVAKGKVISSGYGGVKDLYDISEGRIKRKKVWEYDLKELQVIEGERTHYLLPESDVGPLAQKLRSILKSEYGVFESRLSEMAFDLGISEELLVGYLNGEIPDDKNLMRRMGVMLYKGREGLTQSYAESSLNWITLEKIPEYRRELVRLAREKVIELFGGVITTGRIEFVDGTVSKYLQYTPLRDFLATGNIEFTGSRTPKMFYEDLIDILLGVEKSSDGRLKHVNLNESVKEILYKVVSVDEGWVPLENIPEYRRGVLKLARMKSIELFGGRLPTMGFRYVDGTKSQSLTKNPLNNFLRDGIIRADDFSAFKFYDDLKKILLCVEKNRDGFYQLITVSDEVKSLLFDLISKEEGWFDLEKIPEYRRALIKYAREKMVELFGGRFPTAGISYVDGRASGQLGTSPLYEILKTGTIEYRSSITPNKVYHDLEHLLLGIESADNGKYKYVGLGEDVKRMIYNIISVDEGWIPLEKLSEHRRKLIELARRKAVELFGGRLPGSGFSYTDGRRTSNLQQNPLNIFLKNGTIEYHGVKTRISLLDDLKKILLGVEKDEDGKYKLVAIGEDVRKIIYDTVAYDEGWVPLEQIEEHRRKLVEIVRERVADLFGGKLPTTLDCEDGASFTALNKSPLNAFIISGKIVYNQRNSPQHFYNSLRKAILGVERTEDGKYKSTDIDVIVNNAIYEMVASDEGWVPLEKIPEYKRGLLKLARTKSIELFGGRLPPSGIEYTDGSSITSLIQNPMINFLKTGNIEFYKRITPQSFFNHLRRILLGVEPAENGKFKLIDIDKDVEKMIYDVSSIELEWTPLEEIPEYRRELVRLARDKAFELFGGRLLSFTYADGRESGSLQYSRLHDFIKSGKFEYVSPCVPATFYSELERVLLGVKINEKGQYELVGYSNDVKDIIYRIVTVDEGWIPLEKIPEHRRELVELARRKATELFAGRLPSSGFDYEDGKSSGALANSPLREFLINGEIKFNKTNTPLKFIRDLERVLLGLEKTKDNNYKLVDMGDPARQVIYNAMSVEHGWIPLEKIPEHRRELIKLIRQKVVELYGGQLPSSGIKYLNGSESGNLHSSPINKLISDGIFSFSKLIPPRIYFRQLNSVILGVERTDDAYKRVNVSDDVKNMIYKVVVIEEGWVPLDKIEEHKRELVELARRKATELFGGRLPANGFEYIDGSKSARLRSNSLNRFLMDGFVPTSDTSSFYSDLVNILLGLKMTDNGKYEFIDINQSDLDIIYKTVSVDEGWTPIDKLPEYKRKLVELARKKIFELFYGKLPPSGFNYIDGKTTKSLQYSPIVNFVVNGSTYSANYTPGKFFADLERLLFGVEKTEDAKYQRVEMDENYKRAIYDLIGVEEGWIDIEKIPESRREIVALARKKVLDLYKGRFPATGIEFVDGSRSGYLQRSPLSEFLKTGEIRYSITYKPEIFFNDLVGVIFGVKQAANGKYELVPMDSEESGLVREMKIVADAAWASRGSARTIIHPDEFVDSDASGEKEVSIVERDGSLKPSSESDPEDMQCSMEKDLSEQIMRVNPDGTIALEQVKIPRVDEMMIRGKQAFTRASVNTAVGGVPFGVGLIGADLITGDWQAIKDRTMRSFLREYGSLSIGGGVGKGAITPVINGLGLTAKTGLGAIMDRSVPLFTALLAMDLVQGKEISLRSTAVSMTNVLVASGTVKAGLAIASRAKWAKKLATGLKLIKTITIAGAPESGGATLLGACAISIAEFTVLKGLAYAEETYFDWSMLSDIDKSYDEAVDNYENKLSLISVGDESITIQDFTNAKIGVVTAMAGYGQFFEGKKEIARQKADERIRNLKESMDGRREQYLRWKSSSCRSMDCASVFRAQYESGAYYTTPELDAEELQEKANIEELLQEDLRDIEEKELELMEGLNNKYSEVIELEEELIKRSIATY